MPQFTAITSKVIPMPVNNVDTDQIIPARFLKVTDKAGLGQNLFCDWRYDAQGAPRPDFIINRPEHQGAHILLAGDNFGCGSSREHAPWALTGWGIQVVISTSFADIFRSNALKNGLIPLVVDEQTHAMLFEMLEEMPRAEWTVDLEAQMLRLPTGTEIPFQVDPFSRACLLQGVDELGYIQSFSAQLEAFEQATGRL
jgi:3-isopropylmalate/(R)-2-methylmalate dehydratase small subunit